MTSSSGDASMSTGFYVNTDLLEKAAEIIENTEPSELTLIPLNEKVSAAISRNPEDLLPLDNIIFNGITYYIGMPKQ